MSSDEIDAFRAELLRQKLIFESELHRQREDFEERLATVTQELADREADCRNLQSVVTILGKKIDLLAEHYRRPTTPMRRSATPQRNGESPPQEKDTSMVGNSSRNFMRRPSPVISANPQNSSTTLRRIPSLTSTNRTSSPLVGTATPRSASANKRRGSGTSSRGVKQRTGSAHRLNNVSARDEW
ncbi:hypothetical protein ADEAN_000425700 [Angomonas deanei]|uniref:Uncharacterized protein n=1 Tax=Angomonas deanei TaxID=59799 RepID=A0A7G2CB91_9TRYP|nr:hypothetical protein ADEAN_000425700 [Angomonas deanei]